MPALFVPSLPLSATSHQPANNLCRVEWRPISWGVRLPARAGQSSMSMMTSATLGQSVC